MTNVYSLDGILVFGLLFVCTCAYFKKVPRLKTWLLSEKKGVWGVFYKAAVIGTRLHAAVAVTCVVMAFYVLFIKWIPKHPSHQLPTKGTRVKSLSAPGPSIGEFSENHQSHQDDTAAPAPPTCGANSWLQTLVMLRGTPESHYPSISPRQTAHNVQINCTLRDNITYLLPKNLSPVLFLSPCQDLFERRLIREGISCIQISWKEILFKTWLFFFFFTVLI